MYIVDSEIIVCSMAKHGYTLVSARCIGSMPLAVRLHSLFLGSEGVDTYACAHGCGPLCGKVEQKQFRAAGKSPNSHTLKCNICHRLYVIMNHLAVGSSFCLSRAGITSGSTKGATNSQMESLPIF